MSRGGRGAVAALNLARRPFVNTRPVARVAIFLWVVGGLLFLLNLWLYASYFTGSEGKRLELAELERRTEDERRLLGARQAELARLDLANQNRRVEFLNVKIHERTFSWSLLFDRLAEILPPDVRLTSLSPQALGEGRRGAEASRRVALDVVGVARSVEAELAFLQALYDHPAFESPTLQRDSRTPQREVLFALRAAYLPEPVPAAPAEEAEVGEEVETAGEPAAAAETTPGDVEARVGEPREDGAAAPAGARAEPRLGARTESPAPPPSPAPGSGGAAATAPPPTTRATATAPPPTPRAATPPASTAPRPRTLVPRGSTVGPVIGNGGNVPGGAPAAPGAAPFVPRQPAASSTLEPRR